VATTFLRSRCVPSALAGSPVQASAAPRAQPVRKAPDSNMTFRQCHHQLGDRLYLRARRRLRGLGRRVFNTLGVKVFDASRAPGRQPSQSICAAALPWHWPSDQTTPAVIAHRKPSENELTQPRRFRRSSTTAGTILRNPVERGLAPRILQHGHGPARGAVRNRLSRPTAPARKTGQHRHSANSACRTGPRDNCRSRNAFFTNRSTQGPCRPK